MTGVMENSHWRDTCMIVIGVMRVHRNYHVIHVEHVYGTRKRPFLPIN